MKPQNINSALLGKALELYLAHSVSFVTQNYIIPLE